MWITEKYRELKMWYRIRLKDKIEKVGIAVLFLLALVIIGAYWVYGLFFPKQSGQSC